MRVTSNPSFPADVRPGTESEDEFARALVEEHSNALHAYVIRILKGDVGRGEDIVQETFLRAWQHRTRIQGRIRPWLYLVARNLAIDSLRRQSQRPHESMEGRSLDLPDARVEDEFEAVLNNHHLVTILRPLPAHHRETLLHLYVLGRTQTETARVLGVPPGTVKSRAHHAIVRLRQGSHQH